MPAEARVKTSAKPGAKPDAKPDVKRPRAKRARANRRVPMVEWSPPAAEPVAAPSLVPAAAPVDEATLPPLPLPQAASQPAGRSPRDTLAAALTVAAVTIVGLGWLAVYVAMVPPPTPIKLLAPAVSAPPPKPFTERLAPSAFGDVDMAAPQAEAAVKTVPTVVLPRATEPLPPISHKSARAKRHKTRN
jgi:hypothetical protein